ncbi:MAG TPA: FG-GAP-like repeat-containing protein, partial [Rhizomicrobium sp.]|nr:FG-GAP-like repeat-containing protein [Rhizomicrobium sp.]
MARLVLFAAASSVWAASAASAADAPLMALSGTFAVDPMGAATYSIPIAVPPGTAGMVPALSLAYSSTNGDGVLGIGWAITGLPAIERCARTMAQDGVHGGVNYDANDRFCLNGERLVLISGIYGADGSEYRTEVESFTRIIAHGTAGSGPSWFELHERSGEAEELGDTTDSRILAVGSATARIWAVDKVYDTKGNYFSVTYVNDATNGQFYPSRIDYTGHSTAPVLGTYNSVQFAYTARPDTTPFYHAGSLMKTTVLLADVKTFAGATLVHDYKLTYLTGSSTAPSRLSTVTVCDGASNCLPATTLGWQGSLGTVTATATPISLAGTYLGGGSPVILPGAYNGDGLTDFLVQNPGGSACPAGGNIFVGTPSGFVPGNFTNGSGAPYCRDQIYTFWNFTDDLDGDGLTDIFTTLQRPEFDGRSCCIVETEISRDIGGASFLDHTTIGGYTPMGFGDFNGDGRGDYLSYDYSTNTTQLMLGDGTGSFTATAFPGPTTALPNVPVIGDFDGDGCSDELSVLVYLTCAPAVATFAQPSAFSGYQSVTGDFNGDGMTDILYYKSGAAATLFLSTGTGFVQQTYAGGTDWNKYRVSVGDWNGDGKMDLLLVAPGGTGFYGSGTPHQLLLSTGSGFVSAPSLPNSSSGVVATVADWNNDGADDIWLQQAGTLDSLVTLSYVPDMLKSVSNGIGAATTITYDRINKNGSIYTKGSGAAFPTQDVDKPMYVVVQLDLNDGLGTCAPVAGASGANCFTTTYSYAGAKLDLQGRGFLGFTSITAKDLQTGIVTTTAYNTAFPYTGTIASTTALTTLTRNGCVAGKTVQSVVNTYTATSLGGTRNLVELQQSVSAPGDCDGSALPSTATVHNTYDAYGNPTLTTTTVSDGSSVTTTDTYSNDAVNWFIGRMTATTVKKVVGSSTITRNSSFAFDPATGLMTTETIEPGTIYAQQTVYAYDAFGHRVTATVSGAGGGAIAAIPNHVTSAGYDAIGQFQTSATGEDGYVDQFAYDARFGTVATHTDVNGHITSWSYDGFARKTLETRPDGNTTVFSYPASCGGACPGTAVFEAKAVPNTALGVQNGLSIAVFYDALGRETLDTRDGFAQPINVSTVYDANGNVHQKSRPYFTGGSILYATYSEDDLGRVAGTTAPDTGVTTAAYHGLSATVTNPNLAVTTTLKNAQGMVASVTDTAGHPTRYVYDAYNNLSQVTDALGNVTTNTYDQRGNKIASTDPDLGHWTYGYDVLGELVTQTDAKSQVTTLTYDLEGHLTQRVEADLTTAWTYGTAAPDKRLVVSQVATGAAAGGTAVTRTYGYDALSRPNGSAFTAQGNTAAYAGAYTGDGRLDTVRYPSGFVAKYVYTALGYLAQVKDNGSGAALYTVSARNADLGLTAATAGNGVAQTDTYDAATGRLTDIRAGAANGVADFDYAYDKLGNLTYRADGFGGLFERFCYDALNRLTAS